MAVTRREFMVLSGAALGASAVHGTAFSQTATESNGGLYWPTGQALPTFPAAISLDAADLSSLSGDEQGLLATFQGVVNRTQPRLYFYWGSDPTNLEWLNTIQLPHTITTDPWSLFTKYRSEIKGAVLYDTNVPDTVNLATTMAGMKGGVIATADLAAIHNLPIIEDLQGRFTSKLHVYQWALANVWPKVTNRLLTAIGPTNQQAVPNVNWTTLLKVSQPVTDASNRGTYTADLSGQLGGESVYVRYQDAYPGDGWGPSVSQVTITADGSVIASFQPGTDAEKPFLFDPDSSQLASGWRFADGNNYFIYKFTPPAGTTQLTLSTVMWNEYLVTATNTAPTIQVANPNFRDYIAATNAPVFWLDPEVTEEAALFTQILQTVQPDTPYLGWFPHGHEMTGVTLCGQNSTVVVAADFFYNASAFSGVRATIADSQPVVEKPKLENKIYLSLTMVEGDNIQYNQHRMRQMWDDPGRGAVPLGWSISVLLLDIAPAMLSYFQQTQTINDLLVAGPSGAGYTYPAVWPSTTLPGFVQRSGSYMAKTGMQVLFAYNRNGSTDLALSSGLVDLYNKYVPGLQGIMYNYESTSVPSMVDGVPVATLLGVNDTNSGTSALSSIAAGWDGTSPLFVAAGLESWNMTPTDAKNLVNSLGSEFEVVRPDVFFQLIKQAMKG
ncbi:MAG TPA: GxGYxYP domain-containing protein [Acidisarcina sp.]|nr:GxGYxYP domain-containing protein [Acidisarcina sp.]